MLVVVYEMEVTETSGVPEAVTFAVTPEVWKSQPEGAFNTILVVDGTMSPPLFSVITISPNVV